MNFAKRDEPPIVMIAILAVILAAKAHAEFTELETFDSLVLGEINNQSSWSASLGNGAVVVDPSEPANQVLQLAPSPGVLSREALIAQGTQRMLFLRFRFQDQQNLSFGMSHLSSPTEFSDFGTELRRSDATNDFKIHDGKNYERLTSLEPDTWYNLWAWIDSQEDQTRVWLHHRDGEPAFATDQLTSRDQDEFGFRTPTNTDLIRFYIKSSSGGGKSGPFWFDDLYLEDSSLLNLTNPTLPYPLGDFNRDQIVDVHDVNLLSEAIAANSDDLHFDLDASQSVDLGDLNQMIHEVMRTSMGDANLDGEFNTRDLVMVLEAGKYETQLDAGWSHGDWTADLRFGTADLVAALMEGTYEQGPQPSSAAVPEPNGSILALAAILVCSSRFGNRRRR